MQAGKRTTLRVSLHMLFSSFSFDNFLSFFFEVCFCLVFPARLLFVPVHVVKRKGRLKPTTTARNPLRELSGCKKTSPDEGQSLLSTQIINCYLSPSVRPPLHSRPSVPPRH